MNPGEEQGTYGGEVVLSNLVLGPVVILPGTDDEFDFIGTLQMRQIFPPIARVFTAAGTFEVHNSPNPGIDGRDIVSAARLQQDGEAIIAEILHQN